MGTESQVQSGVKWISISMLFTRVGRLLTTLILARLLAPELFGIIGMAHVTLEILQTIREMGFGLAYIQRQESNPDQDRLAANTTFWLNGSINFLLFITAFLATPLIGDFFRSQDASNVLRVLCFTFLIDIFIALPSLDLQKQLKFKQLTICEIIQALVYAIASISMALAGFGVWSLVIGQLLSKLVFMLSLWRHTTWRPRWEFSFSMARQLFQFGKYMWAFVLLSGIGDAMDKILVGRFYGEAAMGIYSMAFLLATMPATNITQLVNRLTFPLFSKMQTDLGELRAALQKTISHISVLALPVSLGILVVAPLFVSVVLAEKWAPMVPLLSILCYYGVILAVAAVTGPALKAIGKPQILFYASIIHHTIKVILLFALRDYGPIGICYAVLIPILVSSTIGFIMIQRYLKIGFQELMMPILRPAIAAIVMVLGVRFLMNGTYAVFPAFPEVILLILCILAGAGVYLGVSYYVNRSVITEFAQQLRKMLGLQRARTLG